MSVSACRAKVKDIVGESVPSHLGLLLERYLPAVDCPGEHENREKVLKAAIAHRDGRPLYQAAYARWMDVLQGDSLVEVLEAPLVNRLYVGLGGASPLEFGVSLQHTYGYPMIPGSEVKGRCAAYADAMGKAGEDAQWQIGGAHHGMLFGAPASEARPDTAGAVDFLDAWWIPDGEDGPFKADVITGHHPNYYTGKGGGASPAPPVDYDAPNPVSLLSVAGGFCFAVRGPEGWRELAMDILRLALADRGIGSKTRSGYGRFLVPPKPVKVDPVAVFAQKLGATNAARLPSMVAQFVDEIGRAEDAGARRKMAALLLSKVGVKKVREARQKGKSWIATLDAMLSGDV